MTRAIALTYSYVETHTEKFTKIFLAIALILSFYYGYAVFSTISNTVATERLQSGIATISSELGNLDISFMSKTREIDEKMLQSHNLIKSEPKVYISQTDKDSGLAFARYEF